MSEKTNIPQIRFKGFNDVWEQCKLNDLGVSTSGTSIESEFSDEGVYNVISIGSYSEDSIYNDQGIKAIHSSKTENRVLDEGDLTMILNDKTQAGRILGRVLLIEKSSKYVYNQRTQRIQPYKNKFSSEFLYHLLNAPLVRNKIIKQSQGNTQIYVNWSAIKETEYFVPNLVEQEKLGQMFSKINDLITLHQRKHEKYTNIKKALLEKIFPQNGEKIPQIRFKGFTEAWEQCKFGEIMEEVTDYVAAGSFADLAENVKYLSTPDYAQLVRTTDLKANFTNNDFIYVNEHAFNFLWRVNLNKECIIMPNIGNCGEIYFINPNKLPYKHNVLGPNAIFVRSTTNNNKFLSYNFQTETFQKKLKLIISPNGQTKFNKTELKTILTFKAELAEQNKLGDLFEQIDNLITLHQRECIINGGEMKQVNKNTLLVDYYEQWINVYKEGAIRNVTMKKYRLTLLWLKKIAPKLKLCKLDRIEYQNILNTYALEHERQTTMDFHHQLKGAILDAVDEGYIERDPTRKVIIKGKTPRAKKIKYLNQYELHTLLKNLDLSHGVNFDWLILIIAKTGMRFSEAIALTPKDFDFSHQTLSINKTWDYKESGTFQPTKNKSSVRKIQIDWMVVSQFSTLIKDLPENEPIFVKKPIYNSTINDILKRHCKKNKIPIITVHGLRHTHASLLLFAGVSIASVAQRLGHASMTTTQKTYLHIIQELENKDVDLVMRSLSGLC